MTKLVEICITDSNTTRIIIKNRLFREKTSYSEKKTSYFEKKPLFVTNGELLKEKRVKMEQGCIVLQRESNEVQSQKAALCLIEMFEVYSSNFGKNLSCSRTKLGKLLSIVEFYCVRNGQKVFKEDLYKYGDCGTIIDGLSLLEREYCMKPRYDDTNEKINGLSSSDLSVSNKYGLSESLIKVIKDVFFEFGAYSAQALGQAINPLLRINGLVKDNGQIDLERFRYITDSEITPLLHSSDINTDVICFLFSINVKGN